MAVKCCGNCKKTLPNTAFSKNKGRKSGLSDWCKSCNKQYLRKYYRKNREVALEKSRHWRKKNSMYGKLYHASWREANRDYVNRKSKDWVHNNKEKRREIMRRYRSRNKDKTNAHAAERRASERLASPKWLTAYDIEESNSFYLAAQELRPLAGCLLEVDHIIPLKGKDVCGLHVPWNLQLLTAQENQSKGNRYE